MSLEFDYCTLADVSVNNKGEYGIGASAVDYSDELYTYLRITDINDDGTINKNELKSVDDEESYKYLLKENDIVFARTGNSTGKAYFYDPNDGELVFAGFLIKFSLDDKKINPKYMKYYVLSEEYKSWVNSMCTGSTRPNINAKMYGNMDLKLPPREQQDFLVDILEKLDKKISINKMINKNLFEQLISLYKDWMFYFTPFKTEHFKPSPFGLIPEDWNVGKLGDIIEIFDSKRVPLSGNDRENMEKIYPYYGAASLMDYVDDYIFDGTYLLIGEDGTVTDDKGFPILQYVWGKFWVNNHAHIVKGKNGFNVESLYLLLSQTNIQSIVTGAVQPKVNQNNLKSLEVIIPSKRVINEFNQLIEPFFEIIKINEMEMEKLAKLKDVLLPKLMNGEIDISEVNCDLD